LPGDTIVFSATGADVDAFRAPAVTPGLLAGVAPTFAAPTPLEISRSSDLPLSWSPGGDPCAQAVLTLSDDTTGDIRCAVDDGLGKVTVAATLLANLAGASGSATLNHVKSTYVRTGNTFIEIDAESELAAAVSYRP
jgi:hypothetical protein